MNKGIKKRAIAFLLSLALITGIAPKDVAQAADVENSISTTNVQDDLANEEQKAEEAVATEEQENSQSQTSEEPQLQYVYVESSYLLTPGTQKLLLHSRMEWFLQLQLWYMKTRQLENNFL